MKSIDRTELIVKIAKMYYEHDFSQQAISERFNLSRPYISKLLIEAKKRGIVQIKIFDPFEAETSIEFEIRNKFNLKKAIVIPSPSRSVNSDLHRLAIAAAKFIDTILADDDIIGVAWGATLNEVAKCLINREDLRNVTIVQLSGGISKIEKNTYANEILKNFADALKGTPYLLPLPAVVDSEQVREAIMKDSRIADVLNIAKKANIAIFTMGVIGYDSALARAEYISHDEIDKLMAEGSVGDFCCRFIDSNGEICDESLNKRTIGIELNDLRNKEYSIAIATGKNKVKSILGSLRGEYLNVLITDENTASDLLTLSEGM